MPDMLVNLGKIDFDHFSYDLLVSERVRIVRALAPDRLRILSFIETNIPTHWPQESSDSWIGECEAAMSNNPPSCFLAVRDNLIVGFACYNATGKGYFGPTGVLVQEQGKQIGKALLMKSLSSLWNEGFGYAIIGWPAKKAMGFYEKTVNAQVIENSSPGIYSRMIDS